MQKIFFAVTLSCLCLSISGCVEVANSLMREFDKQLNEVQTQNKRPLQTKSQSATNKPKQSINDTECEKLLARIKSEDRQYLDEELFAILNKMNEVCKPSKQKEFQYTSVGGFAGLMRDCNYIKSSNFGSKVESFLTFCSKIVAEPKKSQLNSYLNNYHKNIESELNKEFAKSYPDKEDRAIIINRNIKQYQQRSDAWGHAFDKLQHEQWKAVTGYAVYGNIDVLGSFSGFARSAETDFLANSSNKKLNCTNTSYPGIAYCGKVYTERRGVGSTSNTVFVFKLTNQKVVVKEDDADYRQVINRNLRSAFLEAGLEWDDHRLEMLRIRAIDLQ